MEGPLPERRASAVVRAAKLRYPVVVLLLVLAACDPCGGYVGPDLADPEGVLAADEGEALLDTLRTWNDWTGGGRMCVDHVRIASADGGVAVSRLGTAETITVDPDAVDYGFHLLAGACTLLDHEEALSATSPDLFTDVDDDPYVGFADHCGRGPPDVGWVDDVESACGTTAVPDVDRFLLDVVYPAAPRARDDGALTLEETSTVRITDGRSRVLPYAGIAPLGDHLVVDEYGDDADTIVEVDPLTGGRTEHLSLPHNSFRNLFGGPDQAVLLDWDTMPVVVYDVASSTPLTTYAHLYGTVGTVLDGVLYLGNGYTLGSALDAFDLATGRETEVALPDLSDAGDTQIVGLWGWHGSVVVAVDVVDATGVVGGAVLRYTPSTAEWQLVAHDIVFSDAAVTSDGVLFGLAGSGPEVAWVALALDDGSVWVSRSSCAVGETIAATVAAGGAVYRFTESGDDYLAVGVLPHGP